MFRSGVVYTKDVSHLLGIPTCANSSDGQPAGAVSPGGPQETEVAGAVSDANRLAGSVRTGGQVSKNKTEETLSDREKVIDKGVREVSLYVTGQDYVAPARQRKVRFDLGETDNRSATKALVDSMKSSIRSKEKLLF